MKNVTVLFIFAALFGCAGDDPECWEDIRDGELVEVCCVEYDGGTCIDDVVVSRPAKPQYCYDEGGRKVCYDNPR